MADALEQTKDIFSVDDFNEDDISDKSKLISALENPFGEFRPKEEIVEKAKATGTGLLTGTLGIPSDAATLASAVSSGMAKYADSPTAMMLKDVLEKAKDDVGRPAFDKWFTETTGLESNPENVDQLVGEVLSPTGAFLAPVKTLKNIFAPLKKGVTDFFDKMPPPDSGLAVETAGVGQLNQTKNLLDKESIAKPIETNVPALPQAGELANKPTINPTIIGTQTETGKKAEAIYDDLVSKGVTDPKEIFKKTGGGYVGRDGKFRFDLDDRDAKFKKDLNSFDFDVDREGNKLQTKTIALGKLLEFEPLYKQYYKKIKVGGKEYDALKNTKVIINYADTNNNTLGFYRSSEDTIHLNMQNLINPKFNKQQQTDYNMSTLIHEVQHAVQRREGFSSGANSDDTKDIVLDGINEDGIYKLPLGSYKKEITTPYISGISRYNTDNAYHAYSEADILSRAIKNNTNTDKFIHLADNISDNIPDFTGDRKIEFLRNYEILLDSKNKLKTKLEKYNTKQKKFVKDLNIPGAEVLGTGKESKGSVPTMAVDILPADFNKAKSAFGFKDKDTLANFVFEDLKSLDDLKGFVDRAYNRARVNINLDDKALAKLEAEQARRLKNDEALLNFKGEVDREATRLYLDEYGEMEARLVEQRYARRQELRRDPMLLTDEQITEKMLEDTGAIFKEPDKYGRTTKILGGFKKMNKGGDMNKQMEMFEEGGLKQEGGTIDPVSGNDVPPGSTQEEVRDDIPAQLSEGEFVFPADVVRYIGLEKLMQMRQEAKQGLKMMEEMGQMGNSEEATMPDDLPFDETDLDIEDEEEYNNDTQEMNQGGMVRVGGMEMPRPRVAGQQMAEGGVVKAQTGTFVAPGTGVTTIPSQFAGQNLPSYKPTETIQSGTSPSYVVPTIPTSQTGYDPKFMSGSEMQTDQVAPSFQTLIGGKPGQYDEFREYVSDSGMRLQIPFKNGQPIYPIPEGYKFVDPEEEQTQAPTLQTTQTKTTQVSGDGGDDTGARVGTTMVGKTGKGITDKSLSTNQKTANVVSALQQNTPKSTLGKAIEAGAKGLMGAMIPGVGLLGGAALGTKSFFSPSGTSTQGLQGIGFTTDTAQGIGYDAQGNVTVSGPMASVMGRDAVMDTLSQAAYGMSYAEATKAFGAAPTFAPGYKNGQVDPTTGATYAYGQATDDDGGVSYSSIDDFGIGMAAMSATGFMGGLKDAERVAEKGKTEKARQRALNYISFVKARSKQKEQAKKDEESTRGGTGDLGGIGDLGSGYGIGESTGRGSQTVGTEDVDPTGGGKSTGTSQGTSATGISTDDGGLGGAGDQSSSDGSSSDPGGATEGVGDYNQGGIAKRKPKVKKMKRGGLASKK
jgi:hypothetical protein